MQRTIHDILPFHDCGYYCTGDVHCIPMRSADKQATSLAQIQQDLDLFFPGAFSALRYKPAPEQSWDADDPHWTPNYGSMAMIPGLVFVQIRNPYEQETSHGEEYHTPLSDGL